MAPRKTTDYGALFETVIDDLRVEICAAFDRSLSELERRVQRLEKRLEGEEPTASARPADENGPRRRCSVCGKPAVARGLCSAHYQQWRYRVRKAKARIPQEEVRPVPFTPLQTGFSHDN